MKLNVTQILVCLYAVFAFSMLSCTNTPNSNQLHIQEQGVFDFLSETGDIDEDKELPSNIDPASVLCFGKGLKVGRCISRQLETGICIGLTKHHKHVIAIEIPCDAVTRDSTEYLMITE